MQKAVQEHEKMIEFLENRDADDACKTMELHILRAKQDLLRELSKQSYEDKRDK
jgi:DNA-binding GntR family transcriptional regulator